ncbi:MAG TPA: proline iminopeptidase-family hydrolase [Acidimicrobiales bacterium]|nr:proline iminopeptidase-family hydrolase [Acidimicrobiales bacterium]
MIPAPTAQGRVPFRDGETWYRVSGELGAGAAPLVVLHGGPGAAHDYVSSLADLADTGRAVVHYDQLGCGRSTHFSDRGAEFYDVALFLDELANLLSHLGLAERYHLLGQSWGGMLAAEHAIRRPAGLRSLVISNSPASMALWMQAAARLRLDLPADVRAALDRHEADGTTEHPDYLAATQVFYDRHVCRVVPNPPEVTASFDSIAADPTVYWTMNGPTEFHCIGTLRAWSVVDEVSAIEAPTLLCSGRFDEATPATVQPFFDGIPDVRWERFEQSSHMPFVEEPAAYRAVVAGFLAAHD